MAAVLRILRGCHVEKDLWPALLGQILRNCLFTERISEGLCVERYLRYCCIG